MGGQTQVRPLPRLHSPRARSLTYYQQYSLSFFLASAGANTRRCQEVMSPRAGHCKLSSLPQTILQHSASIFGRESLVQWLPHGIAAVNSCLWCFAVPEEQIRRERCWPDLFVRAKCRWEKPCDVVKVKRQRCRGESVFFIIIFHIIEFP